MLDDFWFKFDFWKEIFSVLGGVNILCIYNFFLGKGCLKDLYVFIDVLEKVIVVVVYFRILDEDGNL